MSLFLLFLLLQKLWELAKQVSEFLVWRQVMCPFDRDRRVLQYLVTTPVFSEDGAYGLRTNTTPLTLKSSPVLIGFLLSVCLRVQSFTWPRTRAKGLRTTWRRTAAGPSGGSWNPLIKNGPPKLVKQPNWFPRWFSRSSLLHRENRS